MSRAARLAALLAPLLAGCGVTVGRLAVMTTAEGDARAPVATARPAAGRSCVDIGVVFPITRLPSIERAVNAALARAGGRVLRDVEVRYEILYLPLVYGRACYVVRGHAS